MVKNKSFCVLPWNHVFLTNSGRLTPCCLSQNSGVKSSRCSNIEDIEREYNSPQMMRLREEMLAGNEPQACRQCIQIERSGAMSFRQSVNTRFPDEYGIASLNKEVNVTCDPTYLDFRVGNLCNLRCRMCSPNSSRLLIPEWRSYFGNRPLPKTDVSKSDNETLLRQGLKKWQRVRHIHFAGGEPLISKVAIGTLLDLVKNDRAKDISLRFNTNLIEFSDELMETLTQFKKVVLVVSVDGYGELNNYIRYPSQWDTLLTNLTRIPDKLEIAFQMTVQIYNVFSIHKLTGFLLEHFGKMPQLGFVNEPVYFNIQSLPQVTKMLALERLRAHHLNDVQKTMSEKIENYMMATDNSNHFPEFLKWTQHFDNSRNQSVRDFIPELSSYFDVPEISENIRT